jgi:hypothetical protein
MLAGGDDDAEACAVVDVDMGIDAALADEAELVQALEQRRPDRGALADENQRFRIPQTVRQCVDVLHVIIPDGDVVPRELLEAIKGAKRIEIVVENGDVHESASGDLRLTS